MLYFRLKSFNLIKWRNNDVILQYPYVWFSLGHKRSYDSDYGASENSPLWWRF